MADHAIAHFKNDNGIARIAIGVHEFKCMGASAPFDHPHVYLDMGDDHEIICPYCSTLYTYDSSLASDQSNPEGCVADPGH
ncbi:MAG: zinc-finger domain-containing protein [Rhodobiaceae bacterium]|nr:zinc-finger domain-containing protein [Rhodobiaceae bacterium]